MAAPLLNIGFQNSLTLPSLNFLPQCIPPPLPHFLVSVKMYYWRGHRHVKDPSDSGHRCGKASLRQAQRDGKPFSRLTVCERPISVSKDWQCSSPSGWLQPETASLHGLADSPNVLCRIKHTEFPGSCIAVIVHRSEHSPPNASFSVHVSACLSFLHFSVTPVRLPGQDG